jgi:hypothetical protein
MAPHAQRTKIVQANLMVIIAVLLATASRAQMPVMIAPSDIQKV